MGRRSDGLEKTYSVELSPEEWSIVTLTMAAGALFIAEKKDDEDGYKQRLAMMEKISNVAESIMKQLGFDEKGREDNG